MTKNRTHSACFIFLVAACVSSNLAADMVGTGTGGNIPDGGPGGFESSIKFNANEEVQGLSLSINGFEHSWVGDLVVTLQGPDGTTTTIMDRTGDQIFHDDSNVTGTNPSGSIGSYRFHDNGNDWWDEATAGDTNYMMTHGEYKASDATGADVSITNAFAGKSTQGFWILNISDRQGGDVGSFTNWNLTLNSDSSVPEPGSIVALSLAALLLATRRRRFR